MEMDLIRNKIDDVDAQLTELFVKRMELVREIGIFKQKQGLPVENSLREKEILNKEIAKMPADLKLYGKQFFGTVFDTSKAYQSLVIDAKSSIKDRLRAVLIHGPEKFPVEATVACQGVSGAYSGIAAEKMFELSSISYFKDWEGVFAAVEKNFCEFGVLPVENSSAGSVNAVYDLMRKYKCSVVRAIKLRIQHYLLAKQGAELSDIKEIISHEQAVSQCAEFLNSLKGVKVTICENTAQAARIVAESGRKDIACISARECAGIYGLTVLRSSVQDSEGNYTRFIAISKTLRVFEGSDKMSLCVNLPHVAGSLRHALNRFYTIGLNLTKIESRPMKNSPFEFFFYFDFEADPERPEVLNLLSDLENTCDNFSFLGAYKEIM